MAIVTPTVSRVEDTNGQFIGWAVTWATMHNGDVGAPVVFGGMADRSFQVTGTFGAGGTVTIEGSNDGANFYTLNNPQGVALNIAVAGLNEVMEVAVNGRPHVTNGDGTTSLNVTAFFRRIAFP